MSFTLTLGNVLLTLLYILPGYAFCKWRKLKGEHLTTLSALLVYLCSPCQMVSSFLAVDFSLGEATYMVLFFLITLVLQSIFMGVVYFLLCRKHKDSKYRIFSIATVLGNVGFFGQPLVRALLPNYPEALCYSMVFSLSMNVLAFSMGVFCLTGNTKYMSLKPAILNPTMCGFAIALPMYIFGVGNYLPTALVNSIDLLGRMTAPLCMIILGIRLATVKLKPLFMRPLIYALCASKMLIFPLFCYAAVYFLPLPFSFKATLLILTATPCAAIILNLAELHESETELAANCVLVTTLLCFLTIPIMTLLL